ncbi:MAG: DNA-deoxyinosine glycosylase [Proteobacteria bacterium]|nr:DNA-deoxyinosine glycosylase [Pseudomonadota bacterium]
MDALSDAPLAGLAPVVGRDARILILGSFPGVASLAAAQYYAHPRNHFWTILGTVLDEPLPALPYPARLARLKARRVGLWDTIVACQRSGSLDASIRNPVRGEIERIARVARNLEAVAFNGNTAARAEPAWRDAGYATLRLPSTSPAYTRPLAEKTAAWRALARWL